MSESFVQVNSGTGPKLHTNQRTIGANNVEDEVVVQGEQYLASYLFNPANVSIATSADHFLQIMAGASLNVYVRRIRVFQAVLATTAAIFTVGLLRLTTAGTGGTAVTPQALDSTDGAAGATAMVLPTVKGTEGANLGVATAMLTQTVPTAGGSLLLVEWDFDKMYKSKHLRIPAGTANGICLKTGSGHAGASVRWEAWITEANF